MIGRGGKEVNGLGAVQIGRFAGLDDEPDFKSWLERRNLAPGREGEVARVVCRGMRLDDNLLVMDAAQTLWLEYMSGVDRP